MNDIKETDFFFPEKNRTSTPPPVPSANFKLTKLNKEQAEFFQAKGPAFRELWLKRLRVGITHAQIQKLNKLIAEFHATEEP